MTKHITLTIAGTEFKATVSPTQNLTYGFYATLEDGSRIFLDNPSLHNVTEYTPEIEVPSVPNTIFTYTGKQTERKHVLVVNDDGETTTNIVTGKVQPFRKVKRWINAGSGFEVLSAPSAA